MYIYIYIYIYRLPSQGPCRPPKWQWAALRPPNLGTCKPPGTPGKPLHCLHREQCTHIYIYIYIILYHTYISYIYIYICVHIFCFQRTANSEHDESLRSEDRTPLILAQWRKTDRLILAQSPWNRRPNVPYISPIALVRRPNGPMPSGLLPHHSRKTWPNRPGLYTHFLNPYIYIYMCIYNTILYIYIYIIERERDCIDAYVLYTCML